jgi:isoleucyl-tRNA synthetase
MNNTMSIIETARKLREVRNISLKQPIMSLTVVNKSKDVFGQLEPFLVYIEEEVNVAKILHETDIDKFVKLTCLPNLPSLGPKFKGNKAFGEIRNAITKLQT